MAQQAITQPHYSGQVPVALAQPAQEAKSQRCSSAPPTPQLPRVEQHSPQRRFSDPLANRDTIPAAPQTSLLSTLSHPSSPATADSGKRPALIEQARANAAAFINSKDSSTQALFRRNGLTEERLTPLCLHLGEKCTESKIWQSLDQVLLEAVNAPEEGNLRHHIPQRALLGTVALLGNGSNRFFGVGGLSRFLSGPPAVTNPLAWGITLLSYFSDGLQGAFGTNRIGMDGLSRNWSDWLAGITAFTSAATIAGMAAFGILNLGPLSLGLALGAGTIGTLKLVGSLPFYYLLANSFMESLQGIDGKKEARLEQAVWLTARLLEHLGDDIDLGDNDQQIIARLKAYSDTLGLNTELESRTCRILRLGAIHAPGDKAKNIISDLRQNTTLEQRTIKALAASAVQSRSRWPRLALAGGFLSAALFTGLSSWGEAASVINPLVAATAASYAGRASAAARCAVGYSAYASWQAIFIVMMAGRSLGQAALVKNNLLALRHARQYFKDLLRCDTRARTRQLVRKMFTHGLGVASSLAYTLSFIGAIYTNTNNDRCLGANPTAALSLALLGSAPMLVATYAMGRELDKILVAILNAGSLAWKRFKDRRAGILPHPVPWYKIAADTLKQPALIRAAEQNSNDTEAQPLLEHPPLDQAIHRVRAIHVDRELHSQVSQSSTESFTMPQQS